MLELLLLLLLLLLLCSVRHYIYDGRLREPTADSGLEVMIPHCGAESFGKNVCYANLETY
jgi:hypothetical protein